MLVGDVYEFCHGSRALVNKEHIEVIFLLSVAVVGEHSDHSVAEWGPVCNMTVVHCCDSMMHRVHSEWVGTALPEEAIC